MRAQTPKVLLIDDDEDSYIITRDLLAQVKSAPIDLEWMNTYELGVEAMLRGEHDAYLVDYRLGARDGLELLRQAMAGGCRAPIIIMTGQGDHAVDVQAMTEGAADYLVKGQANGAVIERSIRYAIERYRAMDQCLKDQAQLRILTEQMPAILWTTDRQLRFTSSWGAGLLGLKLQPNELVGQTLFQYFKTDDADHEAILPHRRALNGETVSFEIDWMGRTYRSQVDPFRESGGRIVGTVGISLDITHANEIEDEFRAARAIQEQMFPKQVPSLPGFDLAGVCHPTASTGGDYYDYIPMPCGSLGIVVADVSRHGFASALIMAASKRVIRTLVERGIPFGEALTIANRAIAEDTNSEYFVTLFYARLDPKTRQLTYAGAGHEAYLIDPTEPSRKLGSTALPLGIHDAAIDTCEDPITLAPGQVLLLFTDGYNEARAPAGGMFGTARILETVHAHRSKSAAEIIKVLDDAVHEFCQPGLPHDDLTIVVLKATAES
jgi:FixJ family two-component response regulator